MKFIWNYIDLICFTLAIIMICTATYLLAGVAVTLFVAAFFMVVAGVAIDYFCGERG